MKTKTLMLTLIAATALPVAAQDVQDLATISAPAATQEVTIKELADYTGLSERRVQMVVGTSTSHADYRISYDSARRQFRKALGEERYNDLMAGRRIDLYNQKAASVAKVDAKPRRDTIMAP